MSVNPQWLVNKITEIAEDIKELKSILVIASKQPNKPIEKRK